MSALAGWSTDIKSAPHGRYVVKQRKEGVDIRVFVPEWVILTTKCGKVTRSHYQPEVKRWLMLADGEQPVAWMPWPEPYSHLPSGAAACAADSPAARSISSPSLPSGTNSHSLPMPQGSESPEDGVIPVPSSGEPRRPQIGAA